MIEMIFTAKLIFISLILIPSGLMSQSLEMRSVESNQIVNLSVDHTWKLVNDWNNLNKRVPKVVDKTISIGEGLDATWDIYLTNGNVIKEKMIYHNNQEKTMSYIMTETQMPIQDYVAIIKIEPYGINKSLVSFYTSCKVASDNEEAIMNTFTSFQETYLSNLKLK